MTRFGQQLKTCLSAGIVAALCIAATGCSKYTKLIKSQDYDKMYHTALEYYNLKKYSKSLQLFEEIRHVYSNSPRQDTIAFYTALVNYKMGDFETSSMLFNEFRRTNGYSPFLEEAEYMYAMGFYYSSPSPQRDQGVTIQAINAIGEYLDRYPQSVKKEKLEENLEELHQKLCDKAYLNAKTYYKIGRYKSATVALKNAIAQYPESNHREELMYLVLKSGYELAFHSIESLQRDRWLDMMDAYYNFVSEYPESKYRKDADRMQETAKKSMAKYNEEDTGKNG